MIRFWKNLVLKFVVLISSLAIALSNSTTSDYKAWKTRICSAKPQLSKGFNLNCDKEKLELLININKQEPVIFELVPQNQKTTQNQLAIPVKSYVSLSATHISHLKKLHLLDLMVGFSRIQDLNEQSLIKKHKQGLLIELGMI
ncbi:MAG: hypothetical protein VX619_07835, partial [bacterium]|nr:hypothetical protein [bacterium]